MNPIEKTYLRITEIDTNIINNKIKKEPILPDSLIIKFKISLSLSNTKG